MNLLSNPYVRMAFVGFSILVVGIPVWMLASSPSKATTFFDPAVWILAVGGTVFPLFGFWVGRRIEANGP
ncbi:hypothetical protein V5735_06655 (plasmid) [Haladaptatus sp. SPP-AMP-3]|uniref:hypothetical protein n=1 Tax=Haladaptatus sp. SPP-AMP-3 TaxID=3121295 RepID=UPI003C2C29BA